MVLKRKTRLRAYVAGGRRPWSAGYTESKFDFVKTVLSDEQLMGLFREEFSLSDSYGHGFDERAVEYPWTLCRLPKGEGRLLDAGSVFNFEEIVEFPEFQNKQVTILTLAPESRSFWKRGISYQYGDLRELPFKDNWFDCICTLSTLGHVGMDCRLYTKEETRGEIGLDAKRAVKELMRVLKPGGRLLGSVVFGKRQLINWDGAPFAEQFDSELLRSLLDAFQPCQRLTTSFYRYTEKGWDVSTEKDCEGVEYFNIHEKDGFDDDNAAAARAVALIDVTK